MRKNLIDLARSRLGEPYVLGAKVPKHDPDWHGPWDCAEFASWLVFQCTGKLIGVRKGEAYTGFWQDDCRRGIVRVISVADAAKTPGCFLLRYPNKRVPGHIALVSGPNTTVEAHSTKRGVCQAKVLGRRWDCGINIKI
ncbi:MAG: hypothetical protein JNK63_03810 [Chthonomonas sp.]|nr:hypothetical protein [Chthonomonas sp.]